MKFYGGIAALQDEAQSIFLERLACLHDELTKQGLSDEAAVVAEAQRRMLSSCSACSGYDELFFTEEAA